MSHYSDTNCQDVCGVPYAEGIRSVLWPVIISCPDCAFAVLTLVQFVQNLGNIHWEVLEWAMAYLGTTKHLWLTFGGGSL